MSFFKIKKEKMKTLALCFSKPRGTDQNPEAITHRDGETSGGGEAPPPPEQMETIAAAGGDAESDERALQTTSSGERDRKMELMEKPPTDDVCPICFENFTIPCRAPCGHWYCGGCILQYWNYSALVRPCRCPMCVQPIRKLTPEASLCHRREAEIRKVLRSVGDYNRLFLGGIKGFMLKFPALPLLYLKRLFRDLMNPDRPTLRFNETRLIVFYIGAIYSSIPYDFLGIGHLDMWKWSGYIAFALVIFLNFVGLFLRWRRNRNARQLMVIQAE